MSGSGGGVDLGILASTNIAIKADLSAATANMNKMMAMLGQLEQASKPPAVGIQAVFQKMESGLKSTTSIASGVVSSFGSMKAAIGGLLAALAVEKVIGMVKGSLEWAQSLKELSEQTGITTTKLQELQYRALQFGISTEELAEGLDFFSKSFGQFINDQSGPGVKAFTELGVKAAVQAGQVRSAGDALDIFTKNIQKVANVNQAAAYSAEAFGRNLGVKIVPMLRAASDETTRLNAEAARLGFIVKPETVEEMAQANVKLDVMWELLKRDWTSEIARLAPEIKKIADDVIAATPAIRTYVEEWLLFFGAIDKNSLAGIDAQIGRTTSYIEQLKAQLANAQNRPSFMQDPNVIRTLQGQIAEQIKDLQALDAWKKRVLGNQVTAKPAPETQPPPLKLGASQKDIDAAKKLAEERQALAEKVRTYDAQMAVDDEKAFAQSAKANDDLAVKMAELTNDKAAAFAAQEKLARDEAAAELQVLRAEHDAKTAELLKLNDQYKKLYGTDLPTLVRKEEAINIETDQKVYASKVNLEAKLRDLANQRYLYETRAQQEIRDQYVQSIDDMTSAFESAVENHENLWQKLGETAKKVANDMLNTFIKLTVVNPLENELFGPDKNGKGGTPGYEMKPTLSLASLFGGAAGGHKMDGQTAASALYVMPVDGQNNPISNFFSGGGGGSGGGVGSAPSGTAPGGDSGGPSLLQQLFGGGNGGLGGMLNNVSTLWNWGSKLFGGGSSLPTDDLVAEPALSSADFADPTAMIESIDLSGGASTAADIAPGGISGAFSSLSGAASSAADAGVAGAAAGGAADAGATAAGSAEAAGGVGDFISSMFDWVPLLFAADGAPNVRAGDTYMVGEKGPELFVSDRAGSIVSNDDLSNIGGGITNNIHIHANDAQSMLRSRSQIEAMISRASQRGARGV